MASSKPLKEYLDHFFGKLKPHLTHLNHLQIVILAQNGHPIEFNTINIDAMEEKNEESQVESNTRMPNRLQKDIEIKAFLS